MTRAEVLFLACSSYFQTPTRARHIVLTGCRDTLWQAARSLDWTPNVFDKGSLGWSWLGCPGHHKDFYYERLPRWFVEYWLAEGPRTPSHPVRSARRNRGFVERVLIVRWRLRHLSQI